ncbi:MAG: ribosomal RNA small subunit methyltransferase A [Acidobacteriota bacterium]|nr:ribosomal RNA small subunit methyltransferase A [Acidobacteriota bacterium]
MRTGPASSEREVSGAVTASLQRGHRPAGDADAERLAQPSMRRLREFGVRPDHDLGQCFLVDSNILGVMGRAAAFSGDEVVLEVGGGLGVLSEYLAPRVAHLHVVEVDRRLEPALRDATDGHPNVSVHWGDALKLDLSALRPEPTALVANLPYGIAATLILRTVRELPAIERWLVMVQREVGERLAAQPPAGGGRLRPGSARAYGAASVIAALACDVKIVRAIPRTVFHPTPNVDSVLLSMTRNGDPPGEALCALVHDAFAHRRKALARSLELAGAGRADSQAPSRRDVQGALAAIGHPADVRAERLSAADFRALARALGS